MKPHRRTAADELLEYVKFLEECHRDTLGEMQREAKSQRLIAFINGAMLGGACVLFGWIIGHAIG